ncbi:Bro-N domain-containing protein [Variovorax sp. YR216]|uniref:BRO-N domain-containing protein n=1 Tax=Variovorax sp. YR216 TaxID=1882828 RepID=UPI0008989D73|nr:Bro-N domain-containing protein [Variovorax sp. YR216]SEA49984.1 BRO family, N-terminal domain [Variovorax sp. YR216]
MANAILTFENVDFDVVDIHNVPWLRGLQVASALGYLNPAADVTNLYTRNADEFSEDMTQILDLPTAGGIQPVRIFSPRGCYLLAMLARTERAKAFRQWVLDVLEGRVLPHEVRPTTVGQRISLHKLRSTLLRELQQATAPGLRTAIHQQLQQVSRLLAMPCPSMDEIGRTLRQPGLQGI